MPTLRSCRVLRPRSMAMRIIAPTPARTCTWNGWAEHRPALRLQDLGVPQQQPAPAQAELRVVLVQLLQAPLDLLLALELRAVGAGRAHNRDVDVHIGVLPEELVERRVDEPDDDG